MIIHNRKFISALIMVPILVILGFILMFIIIIEVVDVKEKNNSKLIKHSQQIARQLYEYKKTNGRLPDTLSQAGVDEKVCVTLMCTIFRYKVSPDKQNFKLAARSGDFVILPSNWESLGKGGTCCYGLATIGENSEREGFPKYRIDKSIFTTPTDWPRL